MSSTRFSKLGLGACLLLWLAMPWLQSVQAAALLKPAHVFVVNAPGDEDDPYWNDNVCDICYDPLADPPVGPCGVCTLRAAIEQANYSAGLDEIRFNGVVQPIQPASALPYLSEAVSIDGLDVSAGKSVRLDGSNAGAGVNGLELSAAGCTIRNMTVTGFKQLGDTQGFGIVIVGGNAVIEGNYLGTNAAGESGLGNESAGLYIAGSSSGGNRIGGTTAAQRNVISGNGNTGIQIGDPQGGGIGSANNRIIGNYIGVTPDGSAALPNGAVGVGVLYASSSGNEIGGLNAGEANVLSGNGWHGIALQEGATGTLVRGNLIGLNVGGTEAIPNGQVGVYIAQSSSNTIGGTTSAARNVIAGNALGGVYIAGEPALQAMTVALRPTGESLTVAAWTPGRLQLDRSALPQRAQAAPAAAANVVQGNYIGMNAAGSAPLGNVQFGVMLYNTSGNTVGGATPGAGNVIAAHTYGVWLLADGGNAASGNLVHGNLIGTDPSGANTDVADVSGVDNDWGNYWGVMIQDAAGNQIGGADLAGNTITGNGGGVGIFGALAVENQVQGNRIGTALNGAPLTGGLSNYRGVYIDGGQRNRIGGMGALSNTIAYNLEQGVTVLESQGPGVSNDLRQNLIFGNAETAIDLQNDRRTPNDFSDSDTGPNQLQNYPVFTQRDGATLGGHFRGAPGTTYSLDLYTYRICDAKPWPGYGEGRTWLATQDVQTDVHGNVVFTLTLPSAPSTGYAIAGTLTDPDGNTSEFSNAPFRLQAIMQREADILLYADLDPLQKEALLGCLPTMEAGVVVDEGSLLFEMQALGEQRFALSYKPVLTLTQMLDLYFNVPNNSTSYFADRLWLVPGPQVTFYEPDFPKLDTLIPVGSKGTVDGNQVTVEIAVTNPGPQALTSEVLLTDVATGNALPGKFVAPSAATQHTFPAGETTTVKFLWDTTGFAWDDAQQPVYTRTVRVTLPDQGERTVAIQPAEAELKIRPRPAVLVHGLWSNAQDAWSKYQGFLHSVRPDWEAYAVGDGRVPGVMNTGNKFSPYGESNRLSENAAILRRYVEGVREAENAWHVDLVAHSMGGLISRYYLSNLVWDRIAKDDYPVVYHLVMLGTPNLGSPCAYMVTGLVKAFGGVLAQWVHGDPWDPVIKDLMPHRLEYYNSVWRQSRDVPYSIWAGTKFAVTCYEPTIGDLVVPLPSAYGQSPNGPRLARLDDDSIIHTAMTDELSDFQQQVLPLLAGGPARAHERTLPSAPANVQAFDAQAMLAYASPPPQILWNRWLDVPAGESGIVTFTVPAGEALAVTLVASDTLTASLLDADGAAAGDFTGPWFRTVWADDPITGTWTVAVTNTGVTTVSVTLAAALIGAEEELVVTVGEPDLQGMTPVTATFVSAARGLAAQMQSLQAAEILTVTARLTNDTGEEWLVDLEENGDGVFSALVGPLAPDLYDMFVYAIGPDFYRGTTGGLTVPLARISKTVSPEGVVKQGDPLIYTVIITAAPGTELGFFDPLEDVVFLDFIGTPPPGIIYTGDAITGSVATGLVGTIIMPAEPFVFSFFARVDAPELADELTIANYACVYPAAEGLDGCIWSLPAETNVQIVPPIYPIYLPLVLRNYRPMPVHTFQYGTYFGGVGDDFIHDMVVGPGGYLYLTGETYSSDLGPDSISRSYSRVFVAKLTPDGKTVVYYTEFGGTADSGGEALAVDAAGNVYVTGYTRSATFPRTSGAFDMDFNGGAEVAMDAFVTKLDANGTLVYSSYLGGSGYDIPGLTERYGGLDIGTGIAVQGDYVFIVGNTESGDFPTTPGAYDRVYANDYWGLNTDIFIVKMRLAGQGSADLVYGTFLGGGASFEEAADLVVDSAGRLYITGLVEDRHSIGEFPLTPGAVDTTVPTGWWVTKAYLIKFNPAGGGQSDLFYSTYLGGTGADEGHALALGDDGTVYLTGETASLDFPTTAGAFDRDCGTDPTCNQGRGDAFITRINPNPAGSAAANLLYSTYLGGGGGENYRGRGTIALVSPGEVYVAGITGSLAFPTTPDAYSRTRPGIYSGLFLARLKLQGQGEDDLLYGTYFGGSSIEQSYGVVWGNGAVTVVGHTGSIDFPTTPDALYPTKNGAEEGFLYQFGVTMK